MVLERAYNVPLRREFLKAPRYKRAKKAVNTLRRFLEKHMKSEEVLIGKRLNEKIWERGIKNPPHHINITVVKEDDGKVYAELAGFKYEKPLTEEELKKMEKESKKGAKSAFKEGEEKIKDEIKKLEEKTEQIKEEKAKKGEEKEKELEKLSQKEQIKEKPPVKTSDPDEKKEKEHPANA